MAITRVTNVRLDPDVRERLDVYAARNRRTLKASMDLLLDFALSCAEGSKALDDIIESLESQ